MLDSLRALKSRTKAQVAHARRQFADTPMPSYLDRLPGHPLSERIAATQIQLRKTLECEVAAAESILPSTATDDALSKRVDDQFVDSWARLVSDFRRQLDSGSDLRVLIADDDLIEAQSGDHPTVKFFKGVLNEWRMRLFELPDEQLREMKFELTMMWYSLFALQPLFTGLNDRSLSRDVSLETGHIADELKKLNFKGALDHYNQLAIGNNLWPIGITQYSIHWKFSCDLIDSDRMLHLFNSEPARNAILSIKRLMTKYQEFHQKKTPF
jgi:pre-mRNA-splicing factor 18